MADNNLNINLPTAHDGFGYEQLNMRKFYLAFPKCGTLSHKLTWSHYYEILKCDDALEMKFYLNEAIKEGWKVRELKRQIKSSLLLPEGIRSII